MPRMSTDEAAADPIQVVIDGREFTVTKLTSKLLAQVQELSKTQESETPIKQLALLLGVDPSELADADIVKVGKALAFITKAVREALDSGNPTEAAARP